MQSIIPCDLNSLAMHAVSIYAYFMCLPPPLCVYLSALTSVARRVPLSRFVKNPQRPSTGQDTHRLPGNTPSHTTSPLSLGVSVKDKHKDRPRHTFREIQTAIHLFAHAEEVSEPSIFAQLNCIRINEGFRCLIALCCSDGC